MLRGMFNVVTDGAWGSCGKGLITTALAAKHKPHIISTTNMANAGHTAVNTNGDKFIAKALPSAAILNRWIEDYKPHVVVGAAAAFDVDQMLDEITTCGIHYNLSIHPRAGIITETHKNTEADTKQGTKHIASTMQGCGAFLADKIMRRAGLKLARDYPQLNSHLATNLGKKITTSLPELANLNPEETLANKPLHMVLEELLTHHGATMIHEGSQGFSLDINHGSDYPHCTSRSTTAVQNLADMGLPAKKLGSVYLVIRPYPIRVGNVVEDDVMVGYSGGGYDDHEETTWAAVAKAAGAPPEVMQGELTTVTKRLRRVFTFSPRQLVEAATANGATDIALNFANYIDWSCFGTNDYDELPTKVVDFIHKIEDLTAIPVSVVGTGPQLNHVCFL